MGQSLSSDHLIQVAALHQTIDSFDFNVRKDAEFTIQARAQREIWRADSKLIAKVEAAFKHLMVENTIRLKKNQIPCQAPPLIDLYWWLCILYSKKYLEFSNQLGTTLDRDPSQQDNICKNSLKSIFPKYDFTQVRQDEQSYVWILRQHIPQIIMYLFDLINTKYLQNGTLLVTNENTFEQEIRKQISSYYFIRKAEPSEIPTDVSYFMEQVKQDLPEQLSNILEQKFCRFNSEDYISEYLKFLALLKFHKFSFTPSEEVDLIWHTHQGFTANYRMICEKHFGRFIHHNPTTGGKASVGVFNNQYLKTLSTYTETFKQTPRSDIWPDVTERFDPVYYLGAWVSLRRLQFSLFQVVRIQKQDKTRDIILFLTEQLYDDWEGENLLKSGSHLITSAGLKKVNDNYYF